MKGIIRGVFSNAVNPEEGENQEEVEIILTNLKEAQGSNMYFGKFAFDSPMGSVTNEYGYVQDYQFYENLSKEFSLISNTALVNDDSEHNAPMNTDISG
jgi:hypothetical protein